MKCHFIAMAIGFFVLSVSARAQSFDINEFYPIETSHSYIEFSVKYMGYAKVKGKFETFGGTLRYNENDLAKTSVSVIVDAGSIDTDHSWRDKDLKSDQWFDVEHFPSMTFISKKVVPTDTGFDLIGDITVKDVTKEIAIHMDPPSGILQDTRGDAQVIFTGQFSISRSEFGIRGERWSKIKEGIAGVADNVDIEISILGKQIKEDNFRNWVRNEKRPPGKIYKEIAENGVEAGLKLFEQMGVDTTLKLNSNALNIAGYMLLKEGKTEEALKVFKKNTDAFPDDANVYDSYAEALAVAGDLKKAKANYLKAIEIDPHNFNAKEIVRQLEQTMIDP